MYMPRPAPAEPTTMSGAVFGPRMALPRTVAPGSAPWAGASGTSCPVGVNGATPAVTGWEVALGVMVAPVVRTWAPEVTTGMMASISAFGGPLSIPAPYTPVPDMTTPPPASTQVRRAAVNVVLSNGSPLDAVELPMTTAL